MRRHPTHGTPGAAPLPAVLAMLALLAAALPATAIDVFIKNPKPREGVFGEVEVVAEVLSAVPVDRVEFLLDERVLEVKREPPWTVRVDVGQDNVPHTFEVLAYDRDGAEARAKVVTRTIAVDLAMDLELQQLYVTVTKGGRRVLDLSRESFTVLDEGRPQEIVTFERGDVPLTASLLVDTSVSMEGDRLRAALQGAQAFIAGMRELDEASLMLFSDRLIHVTPFSADPAVVSQRLQGVQAAGGTALNDHLYAALKTLEARQGRRVVILLSDGTDIESVLSIEDVLWKARRSQALVYWIRLRDQDTGGAPVVSRSSAWRNMEGHASELRGLGRLVAESGGRVVEIDRIADATAAFRDVLSELRDQYVIGYYPSRNQNDESWHDVDVKVEGFGLDVRAREGYVDF